MARSHGKSDDRQARLARALRENLKRRKAPAGGTEAGESSMAEPGKNNPDAVADPRRNPAVKPF